MEQLKTFNDQTKICRPYLGAANLSLPFGWPAPIYRNGDKRIAFFFLNYKFIHLPDIVKQVFTLTIYMRSKGDLENFCLAKLYEIFCQRLDALPLPLSVSVIVYYQLDLKNISNFSATCMEIPYAIVVVENFQLDNCHFLKQAPKRFKSMSFDYRHCDTDSNMEYTNYLYDETSGDMLCQMNFKSFCFTVNFSPPDELKVKVAEINQFVNRLQGLPPSLGAMPWKTNVDAKNFFNELTFFLTMSLFKKTPVKIDSTFGQLLCNTYKYPELDLDVSDEKLFENLHHLYRLYLSKIPDGQFVVNNIGAQGFEQKQQKALDTKKGRHAATNKAGQEQKMIVDEGNGDLQLKTFYLRNGMTREMLSDNSKITVCGVWHIDFLKRLPFPYAFFIDAYSSKTPVFKYGKLYFMKTNIANLGTTKSRSNVDLFFDQIYFAGMCKQFNRQLFSIFWIFPTSLFNPKEDNVAFVLNLFNHHFMESMGTHIPISTNKAEANQQISLLISILRDSLNNYKPYGLLPPITGPLSNISGSIRALEGATCYAAYNKKYPINTVVEHTVLADGHCTLAEKTKM